jgi:Peptidase family M28
MLVLPLLLLAAQVDAAPMEAGRVDAAPLEAGRVDAAPLEAGRVDTVQAVDVPGAVEAAQSVPWANTPALSPESLHNELDFVAHDRFEGRRTGKFGGRAMGAYIRSRFIGLGLEPTRGSYLHEFPAEPQRIDGDHCYLQLGNKRFDAGHDFLPHPSSPNGTVSAPLEFVGFGLHAPERGYSDFEGVDLEGKIAVFFRWEPGFADRDSTLDGRRMLPQSTLAAKVKECERRGAVAVLAVTPPDDRQKNPAVGGPFWPAYSQMYKTLSGPMLGTLMPADQLESTNFVAEDALDMVFTIMQNSAPLSANIPVAYLSPRTMRAMFRKANRDTKQWVEKNAASMQADSFPMPFDITVACQTIPSGLVGRNVVGILPGSDPDLRNEYIVVGAHYDHVGANDQGDTWNGADDNGSGTVALLALAETLVALPADQRPKRSIVFAAFSGEEIGLIGSLYFLVDDLVPVEKIAAMVNTDMIGRAKDHEVFVVGTDSAAGLGDLVREASTGLNLTLGFNNEEFFDRSDQVGFYYRGVPIVFFNTDEHDDYHKPTDTSDLIHYQDMAQISVLTLRTIRKLADLPQRLKFQDAYGRLQPVYGQNAILMIPFEVKWEDRLDY